VPEFTSLKSEPDVGERSVGSLAAITRRRISRPEDRIDQLRP
jgi:hypothetical protein